VIEPGGRVWVIWRNDFFVINPTPLETVPPNPQSVIKPIIPAAVVSTKPGVEIDLPTKPDEIFRLEETSTNSITGRLYQSRDGHIWLIADANLFEFDGRKFLAHGAAQGLPAGMGEMAEDSAGNLWISGRTALARLDRKGLITYGAADGLESPNVEAIIEGNDGTLYFVNGDFALSRYDGQRLQTSRAKIAPDARALWTSRAAFLSSANEWWFLTTTKLYRFAAGSLNRPVATYDSHDGFKSDDMYQMFEDSHGDLWLSQQPSRDENIGLYRLKKGDTSFYRFSQKEGLPDGKSAESFAEDRAGNLWFGFYEGGLVRFANDRFTSFTTKDGLPFGLITDLLLDRQGRLWMTSTNGGVSRIDDPTAAKPSFVSLTTEQGLSSNNARTITEDQLGNIYVGTVRGMDQISPDTTRIKHYSVSDGLAGDFVVDSHCDRSGTLWFATTNGLSRFSPGTGERLAAPTIWLGGLRIAGEKQAVSELGQAELAKGELKYTQNNFQIDFFGLDFHARETLRYQFMLEGADSKWSAPTEQRTVTYANLRPGSYRFLVRAVNSDGTQSERPAVLSFKILPPIWLRWWFLTLAILLTIGLLYVFYRYRMARLREVNAALAEAKRAEEDLSRTRAERLIELARVRTRIATDLHDDIGASLTQIAILSEVARQQNMQGNGASLEPLNSIVSVSNELVETMSDIVWAINPEKDRLQDLIQRMRRFASDLLSAKGVHFDFNAPSYVLEIPLGANARREVFLIFKESLTNIAKHANATQVEIDFDVSQDDLRLSITDNGDGFDLEQSGPALAAREKGGHGIFSMKKRAAELNGRLDIRSEVGRGTTTTLQLPLDVAARHARVVTTQMGGDNGSTQA
jgi:signal transduction histidine kinase/streptogramin lyase